MYFCVRGGSVGLGRMGGAFYFRIVGCVGFRCVEVEVGSGDFLVFFLFGFILGSRLDGVWFFSR